MLGLHDAQPAQGISRIFLFEEWLNGLTAVMKLGTASFYANPTCLSAATGGPSKVANGVLPTYPMAFMPSGVVCSRRR